MVAYLTSVVKACDCNRTRNIREHLKSGHGHSLRFMDGIGVASNRREQRDAERDDAEEYANPLHLPPRHRPLHSLTSSNPGIQVDIPIV